MAQTAPAPAALGVTAEHYEHFLFPQQLVIETTAGCNQRCIFCGRTYIERPKKTMSDAIYRKIVKEVAEVSPYTEVWPTFMGESLLLGDLIFDWLEYTREVGCQKITLNTNGTRLDSKVISRILEGNIDRFIISCDAHTPETHAIVRPLAKGLSRGGLDDIYAGALQLIEEKKSRGLSKPILEMQFSIFEENESESEDFRQFWLEKGAIVKVRPKVHWSGKVQGGEESIRFNDRIPCLWSLETMAIHWNGNIVMCAIDCDGKYVAGNAEMQTLQEVWNGPLKWIRELHMRQRFRELPDICRTCPDWQVKKAAAYFPSEDSRMEYETYVKKGRSFLQRHFWHEKLGRQE